MNGLLKRTTLLAAAMMLFQVAASRADELSSAYQAILRGDYAAGRSTVSHLLESGEKSPEVIKVQEWLDSFDQSVETREELKTKTLEWNVEHAKEAVENDRTYLALSFLNQATYYANDKDALAHEPWVIKLAETARAEAEALRAKQEWTKLYSYYAQLSRIFPKDKSIEQTRKDAERHARLQFVYKSKDDLAKRTDGVNEELLKRAVQVIDRTYFEQPDFKNLAEGAVRNLLIMCETPKLREVFDGLANSDLREFFVRKLNEKLVEIGQADSFSAKRFLEVYGDLKQLNLKTVELPEQVVIMEYLEGAMSRLDPFSDIIWPADVKEFTKQIMGNFQGVGIQLGTDELTNRLKVVTPLADSPALKAGVQPGDLIVKVDGGSTKGWTTDDAVSNIMGPAGSKVVLTMYRPDAGQEIDFELTRAEIRLKTVFGVTRLESDESKWNYIIDDDEGVAYIRLSNFNPDSQDELDDALAAAREQGMKALILDLRFNPGGLLERAISTVSTFLRDGVVVSTRGRVEAPTSDRVDGETRFPRLPLVVLVNDNSASASEILSGALQAHDRAIVVGERTFGKGSVQKVLTLDRRSDAALRLTTALYFLPDGRTPHKRDESDTWGVEPNLTIELTPKEAAKVVERIRSVEIIQNRKDAAATPEEMDEEARKARVAALKADFDDDEDGEESQPLLSEEDITLLRSDPLKAPEVDPQLQTALLLLRTKVASNLDWPGRIVAKPENKQEATVSP
jgi:carboxyl-terminal processing protease